LAVGSEVDVDELAQGTNVLTTNGLVDVLVVIDGAVVGFFAGVTLIEIGAKTGGTAFTTGLTSP
jgi:hypothetical protein